MRNRSSLLPLGVLPLLLGLSAPAAAADWKGCYSRSYAPAHLAAHPKQKVQRIDMLLDAIEAGGTYPLSATITANIRGIRDWRVASGDCEMRGDTLHCAIDDDGGSFRVSRAEGHLRIDVDADLRLIRRNDAPGDGPQTDLRAASAEDRSYILDPAPRKACR